MQYREYVVVLGIVGRDLTDVELHFCLSEPDMGFRSPKDRQFNRNRVLLLNVGSKNNGFGVWVTNVACEMTCEFSNDNKHLFYYKTKRLT